PNNDVPRFVFFGNIADNRPVMALKLRLRIGDFLALIHIFKVELDGEKPASGEFGVEVGHERRLHSLPRAVSKDDGRTAVPRIRLRRDPVHTQIRRPQSVRRSGSKPLDSSVRSMAKLPGWTSALMRWMPRSRAFSKRAATRLLPTPLLLHCSSTKRATTSIVSPPNSALHSYAAYV